MHIAKKKYIISSITIIPIIFSIGFIYFINQKVDYVEWDIDYPIYESLEELESDSDLIIIGEPNNIKNYVQKEDSGIVEEGYTITNFKVNHIISQNKNTEIPNEISVVEPYFDYELSLSQKVVLQAGKQIIKNEEYIPMEIGEKYLLFLYFVEEENKYIINGIHQGTYHIFKNSKTLYENNEVQDEHYNQLRKEIIDKYEKDMKEVM